MLGVIAQSAIDNNTPQASAPSYTPPPAQQSASSTYSRSQQGSASGPPDDRNIHDPSLAANQCISVSSESAAGRSNFSWFLRNSCGYSVDVLWTGQNGRLTNMGTVGGGADYPMSDNQGAGTRFTACQAGTLRNNYGTGRAWCHR